MLAKLSSSVPRHDRDARRTVCGLRVTARSLMSCTFAAPQVEWLKLLVEGFSGILIWRVFRATTTECLATCRSRKELWRTAR